MAYEPRSPWGRARAGLAVGAALALAACAGPTTYRPAADGEGFADTRLDGNRFRVSFTGNSFTPRETVENYLIYRAAELTLATGNDHFAVVERNTERKTRYVYVPMFHTYHFPHFVGSGLYGFHIYRYPFFGHGFRPIHWYTAFATIRAFTGEREEEEGETHDAREVLCRLGALVVRPEEGDP